MSFPMRCAAMWPRLWVCVSLKDIGQRGHNALISHEIIMLGADCVREAPCLQGFSCQISPAKGSFAGKSVFVYSVMST